MRPPWKTHEQLLQAAPPGAQAQQPPKATPIGAQIAAIVSLPRRRTPRHPDHAPACPGSDSWPGSGALSGALVHWPAAAECKAKLPRLDVESMPKTIAIQQRRSTYPVAESSKKYIYFTSPWRRARTLHVPSLPAAGTVPGGDAEFTLTGQENL
jgi:hypothetical protein